MSNTIISALLVLCARFEKSTGRRGTGQAAEAGENTDSDTGAADTPEALPTSTTGG